MGGQIKKHFIKDMLLLGFGVFAVFGLFTLQSNAQQTGPPGQDTNSSNILDLLRISDPDGIQVKPGGLRVGNSGTIDISSTFEVYGDLHGNGNLLIVTQGVCNDANNALEPACAFNTVGEQHPAFIADINQYQLPLRNYVGVGTNYPAGKLSISSQQNEFLNGAVYATSTAGDGVWGVSSANPAAGIFGLAINPNTVAVYGKSVDKYSRGVSGFSNGTGAPAGLFWGNVVVTGGYIQGNASGLYRVSSINDSSLSVSEGGRGLGVWGNGEPITVDANTSVNPQTIQLSFNSGERIRSLTVYMRVKDTGSYTILDSSMPVTVSMTPQQLSFRNTSPTEYQAIVFAQIENTLNITVGHPVANGVIYAVNNTQPILYSSNGLYEMSASVGPGLSNEFTWKFSTSSPRGELCNVQTEGEPVNCKSNPNETISGETVYYKFPASYTGDVTWQDPIEVTWAGSTDVVRIVNLKVVDIQTPTTPIVAEYNAGNGTVPRVNIPVTYKTPSGIGQISELTYEPVIPEGEETDARNDIEDVDSSGNYRAPEIVLDDFAGLGSRGTTAPVRIYPTTNPEAEKIVKLYLVPNVNLQTHYAFAQSPQTDIEDTNTTAASKPLNVVATITGYNNAVPANTLTCSGCTSGSIFSKNASNLGPHLISVTWTPTTGYPADVQLTKSKTVYVSTLVVPANASGVHDTNIVVPVTVNFNATGPGLATILSALQPSVYQLNQTVPVGTDYTVNPTVKGGNNHVLAISSVDNISEITFNSSSCNNGTAYTVSLRNPSDLREEKTVSISVTGCSTNTCANCGGCPNDLRNCDPCCASAGNIGGAY